MTKQEITEGNKLIAYFMGFPKLKVDDWVEYDRSLCNSDRLLKVKTVDDKYITFQGKTAYEQYGIEYYDGETFNLLGQGPDANNPLRPYNSSWDWLMPVVEKIENLSDGEYMFEICGNRTEISLMVNHNWPEDKATLVFNNLSTSSTKIESVYKTVVEFIKWYSQQNKK